MKEQNVSQDALLIFYSEILAELGPEHKDASMQEVARLKYLGIKVDPQQLKRIVALDVLKGGGQVESTDNTSD